MKEKPKVLVVIGSDSDFPVMKPAFELLTRFEIPYEARVCSAHRTPDEAANLAKKAIQNGFGVIIAAAGLAAHLPGVMAAHTTLPVIGIPISSGALNGLDALYAVVQMPKGIPVATVAIDGAENAALLAAQMFALSDSRLQEKIIIYKAKMVVMVKAKNQSLQDQLKEI